MTTQLAVRISDEQLDEIDKRVPAVHESRSALIRRALELYLFRLACEEDAKVYETQPLTPDELSIGTDVKSWELAPKW
jgi:Arc/MetJ-type ribon-helix-helix transcriptional regulator